MKHDLMKALCHRAPLIASLLGVAVGHAAELPAPAGIPIHIGYPQANYWPLFLARELKLFEQVGLAPQFHPYTTGAPLIAGMKSGEIDVAWTGLATIFMLGNGVPLQFVLVPIDHSSQVRLVVPSDSRVKSFRDLTPSTVIGAPAGTCGEVSAVLAARKAGVAVADLKLSNLAPNLLVGALKNKQIDGAFIWGPWDLKLREAGFKAVSSDRDYIPGGSVCGVTVAIRPALLVREPSVGCRMVKVHALALEAARKDPELAIRVLQVNSGLSYALAKESFETLVIPSIASQLDPKAPWSLTASRGGLADKLLLAADALYARKAFAQPLDAAALREAIDPRYIKQYIESGCRSMPPRRPTWPVP